MHTLIEEGVVHYWGTSEWTAAQIADAHALCERYGWHLPKTEQPQYSMLYRERVETEILPVTEPRGVGLVVWSPLGMGMLTGKYDQGIPEDSRFEKEPWAKERFLTPENVEKVKQLKRVADELDISRAQLALAWVLRQPNVTGAIIGASRPEQVVDNAAAAGVTLSSDTLAAIDTALENVADRG